MCCCIGRGTGFLLSRGIHGALQRKARDQKKYFKETKKRVVSQLRMSGFHSFIHLSIHPSIHPSSFIHSFFTRLFIRSFVRSFIHSFTRSFICSFIHSCILSCMHAFIHPFVPSFFHLFVHSFVYSFIPVFVHLFDRSIDRSFVHSLIHSKIVVCGGCQLKLGCHEKCLSDTFSVFGKCPSEPHVSVRDRARYTFRCVSVCQPHPPLLGIPYRT